MENFEYMKGQIAKCTSTPHDARKLVLALAELIEEDWGLLFKHLEVQKTGKTCARCKCKTVPSPIDTRITVNEKRVYCEACLEVIQKLHTISCRKCQKEYISAKRPPTQGFPAFSLLALCPGCRVTDVDGISVQLERHLSISRSKKEPASLSLEEWMETIQYFEGMCAYCLNRPYEVLEHFDYAGTTRSNCVPACAACNAIKWGHNPYRFTWKNKEFNDAVMRVRSFIDKRIAQERS